MATDHRAPPLAGLSQTRDPSALGGLRDSKAREQFSPVHPRSQDIDRMGLIEMRDEVPCSPMKVIVALGWS